MKRYLSRKYKLHLNDVQKEILEKHFGHNRFIWNNLLHLINNQYEDYKNKLIDKKPNINYQSLDLIVTQMKQEFDFLYEVSNITYNFTTKQLSKQFKNFFKNPKKFKHPKFKRKLNKQTVGYLDTRSFKIDFENRKIKIPKIGWVKIEKHQKPVNLEQYKLKQVNINKTVTNKYYISLIFEFIGNKDIVIIKEKHNKQYLGIDLGIKDFAVLSTGEKIDNPKYLTKSLKKLRRLQRQYSRKQKGSKNKEKQRIKLQKYHEKIKNQRDDFIKQLVSKLITLVKENQLDGVVVEDLNIKGMLKNRHLSRSISELGWRKFIDFLKYKFETNGFEFIQIDRFFPSSQTCSICGYKNPNVKNLNVREWICPNCGTHHDRDINQQINIQNYPILNT